MEIPDTLFTEAKLLLNAVAHVGCDFGHGPYFLSAAEIKKAQDLYVLMDRAEKNMESKHE